MERNISSDFWEPPSKRNLNIPKKTARKEFEKEDGKKEKRKRARL